MVQSAVVALAFLAPWLGHGDRFPAMGLPQGPSATPPPRATNPHKAMQWRRLTWQDENGRVEPGALKKALEQRRAGIRQNVHLMSAVPGMFWTERGPQNVAGRSRSVLIHPSQTNKLWVGSVSGGIWSSIDTGATWTRVNDWMGSLAIGCMAIDPANPSIMYAGTGEGQFNIDAIGGAGILKSTDGGATWAILSSTSAWTDCVCSISVSPTDHNVLLAGLRYGGIYRSSDGGATWTNPQWTQGSFCVAFHPTDGTKAVASVIDYDWGANDWFHRAYYTTDAGLTWTGAAGLDQIWGFDSRITLAYAPSSPTTVYASCAANGGVIWRSTNGGQSYTKVTTSGTSGANWYANPLWVDPTNVNHLLTGGVDIYRSTDGGVTLTQATGGYMLTEQPHADVHTIVSAPGFNGSSVKRVYACTDGSLYTAPDIYAATTSSGWSRLDVGCRTTQYYGAAGNGTTGKIVGGLQDNGTLMLNPGSNVATLTFGGDGGFCAVDPVDSNYTYGEYIALMMHRSTDGGSSASWIYSGISDAGSYANFIAPFILDPNNVNRLLAGGSSLWRSDNAKAATPTWSAIRPAGSDVISAIAVAPGNSSIVWVGQNDGVIQKTTNGTVASPTWVDIDNNGATNPLPNRYVTRIVVDPANSQVVYACFGGFAADNIYVTRNGGTTWTACTGTGSGKLPECPVRGLARDPRNASILYAGTEVGVFATSDGGANWTTNEAGPAAVSVDELTFMSNSLTLLAATHGRGIWTADLSVPAVASVAVAPNTLAGGASAVGTVTLNRAAPYGGCVVTLSSNHAKATVPASVTVPAGQAQATFSVTTASVTSQVIATLTATLGGSSQQCTLTINVPGIPTTLSVAAASGAVGATVNVSAALFRTETSAAISGATVAFTVAGTAAGSAPTNASGGVSLPYIIPEGAGPGSRTIAANYAGDAVYQAANGSAALTVSKANTSVYLPDRSQTYTESIRLKAYWRRLTDNAGKAGLTITFKVAGTSVGTGATDATGYAYLDWTVTAGAASRTLAGEFAGNTFYNASTGSATLTSTTVATKVYVVDRTNVKIKTYTVLKAYLYTTANVILPGKTLTMTVDGASLGSQATNSSGYISFGYTVPEGTGAGNRVVGASWAGNAGYPASSNTGKLGVVQGNLYLWPYVRSGKRGTVHPLKAYVRSLPDYVIQPGKSITFKVNGSTIGSANVAADGWATVNWSIPAAEATGSHTCAAEFAGDAWYVAVTANTAFNVVP